MTEAKDAPSTNLRDVSRLHCVSNPAAVMNKSNLDCALVLAFALLN